VGNITKVGQKKIKCEGVDWINFAQETEENRGLF
jgi:hypothetical protein